jgi:ParB family chromosome partitioning protein
LLSNIEAEVNANPEKVVKELSHNVAMIPVNAIETNPFQPRTEFDEEALQELADSLKVHGLIQPITVRRLGQDSYQLISGERRLRASGMAGLTEVPAYIRIANDQEMLEMALVENIQRENLNAIEIAITYQRLLDECKLTHEGLSDRVGKNRATITNYLRLLNLPPSVQNAIKDKEISMGHARALAGLKDPMFQLDLLDRIRKEGLSVREVEKLTSSDSPNAKAKPGASSSKPSTLPEEYRRIQDDLSRHFGIKKVGLKLTGKDKGQISIPFQSVDELNRILDLIEKN